MRYTSPLVREPAIKSMVGSSGRQRVQTDVVQGITVRVPVLEEQEAIAGILKLLDDKIDVNKRINDNLEQQAQVLYKSWFVDFEPFGNTVPSDWFYGIIDDLAAKIVCGKTPSTRIPEYYGADIPFITIPDIHNNTYVVETERRLSKIGANSQPGKILPVNSICVSCIGTAGLVSLVSVPSQTNQQINSVIPKEGVSPYYIYLLMKTLSKTINKLGQSGSTMVNLNKSQFGKIPVFVPTVSCLLEFNQLVEPLFRMILSHQQENLRLAEVRDALLPKLMSGKLDVSNIDL